MLSLNTIHQGDCLDLMKEIPDGSVDMVLCDLPYGVTQNKWDTIIPFEPLWAAYKRVCKPNSAMVLTAQQPFTTLLIYSNLRHFRQALIWKKAQGTDFLNAKRRPLRAHEDVCIFFEKRGVYNPQFTKGEPYGKTGHKVNSSNYGKHGNVITENLDGKRYPTSIIEIDDNDTQHPTQKPVALFEYLIRTYTNPGAVVLDNCIGSGTTAVAAINSGRQFIGIEQDPGYCDMARQRVADALAQPKLFY